ncbi:MAG: 4a-hydroxytetrahydrobiopterin dehydratase [Gammaproteobacteria bacterium]
MSENDLRDRQCIPCHGGMPALTSAEATAALGALHADWRLADDGKSLRRDLSFRNFHRTMGFVNALAYVANAEDHHPDLEIGYNYCRVKFTTHAIDGLSVNDFICAAKLDALIGDRAP